MKPDTIPADALDDTETTSGLDNEAPPADDAARRTPGRSPRAALSRPHRACTVALVLLIVAAGAAAGCLWWCNRAAEITMHARNAAAQAARESTVALLSYEPDTAESKLTAARDRLTGPFRDSYTSLTRDVVIPGARQKGISAVANVPAMTMLSADAHHATAMVFVDQTTMIGGGSPTATASVVKVTLDKVDNRWLISGFDPM